MSGAALDALDPAALATVTLGDGVTAYRVVVGPLKLKQLPAFARALQPVSDDITTLIATGASAKALLALVEKRFEDIIEALVVASGAPRGAIEESTIDQGLELVLAVLQANRNFFKGRAASALRMAAVISGTGPTASKPSSEPAGPSRTSADSPSTS